MKKIAIITGALAMFGLAYLSYQYLALAFFYARLSRFRGLVPLVPEQCTEVVADAAVAFSGIYNYVGLAVAGIFLLLAFFFVWRCFRSTT